MLKLINDEQIIQKEQDISASIAPSKEELQKVNVMKSLTMLSKQVVGRLNRDQVPPTPENYKIYFDAQLEAKPDAQKKDIGDILALEAEVDADHTATLEKDIQNAFIYIKSMTESIANAYTKINQLKKITADKAQEIQKNPSRLALVAYEEDLDAMGAILEKELQQIKSRYNATAGFIKNFNKNSIYDKKYGVYNKKYLMRTLDSILKSVENFDYKNTLLSIKITEDTFRNVMHQKDKTLINITLAKLLLKRSRRSDVVGHYEGGIFMIILKHTDKKQAKIAIDRINDMIESANFIMDAQDVDVKLSFGVASIDTAKSKEEILIEAIDSL